MVSSTSEKRRLKAVRQVKQTIGEDVSAELQSIVRLASDLLDVPIALVSIVDRERQDFAANIGLDGVVGTPRFVSFCSHAVGANSNLVVSDAQCDERFASNYLVTGEPFIRAYAGSLIYVGSQAIGTVCAIDREPKVFTDREIYLLEELAKLASAILMGRQWFADTQKQLKRLKTQKRSLWRKAHFDGLTGLANRAYFSERFEEITAQTTDDVALVVLDVDSFKAINDQHGHYVGDQCLAEIAKTLTQVMRTGDIAARLGGDEFAYIIQGPNAADVAKSVFDRVRAALIDAKADRGFELALSAGCSTTSTVESEFDSLYKAADIALYDAKNTGKNRFSLYRGDNLVSVAPKVTFRRQFLTALEQNEIVPYYQPKVSLVDGSLAGFEVLARWQKSDGTVVQPAAFEKAFQDVRLARALAEHMIEQASRDYAKGISAADQYPRLGVNVTAHELGDPGFPACVLNTLRSHGLSPRLFTLEVTENVMLGNESSQAFRSLQLLRTAGVQIAFDDFGTGYGALQHLASWPIDRVKFDRVLVKKALDNERAMIVLSSMIATCKRLGFVVVIEGIETERQALLFSELGADVGQGYYFAKPFPREDLEAYLGDYQTTLMEADHAAA